MSTATQTVTTRLPEFQEQYLADLLASAPNLFKPVSEGGMGLTMPYVKKQLAGLSEGQQMAIASALGGVGAYQPFLDQAQAAVGEAGQLMSPDAYKQFMDPYLDDVVQRAQSDIALQGRGQEKLASDAAVRQGAFGGSRAAVLQGQIGKNTLEQQARTGERLRSAGFTQATQAAQQAATQKLQQAQGLAGLGQLGQALGTQDISNLLGIGSLQQGQAQRTLDTAQANALAQQQLPFQQLGFLADIFRGVPALQQQTSQQYTPPPSLSSQLFGLGIAGLGAYGAMQ
jgi:hypothetical protein|tara:strand:+ start:175 stop:1029 length:855 start_codon:yes stop_codon:yes gene_type:complete